LHPLFLAKYSVQQELGFGATGFVVEATKLDDGRPVAVKFMFKDRIPVESWVRDRKLGMVPLEIFILKKVNHDHIVKFVDYFEDKKFFYLVMETHGMSWIDYKDEVAHAIEDQNMQPSYRLGPDMVPSDSWGSTDSLPVGNARTSRPSPFRLRRPSRRTSQDLFECIEQNPYMAESDVRHIFIQIADAIRHLHQNNIIHRDIKDENIVIDAHKNAKLIDFGNAAFIPRNEAAYLDRFYGTMHCAAPEVLRGERYRGPEQDVWALGVLLYTLAFSQTPFRDAHGIQEGKFSPPRFPRSPSMMDLLHHLLDPVSSTRYTIEDVLQHSWITAPALASVNDALFTPLPSSTITSSPPSVMVPSTTPHSITVIA
ncbi:kinase-like domain-containing protein, partial [Phlyctochytrium arcticum]